jgi:SAM-dependent methyltransferase
MAAPRPERLPPERATMSEDRLDRIRRSYDALALEYARRIADELRHKPLDRELLDRFARLTAARGSVCDLGCGPGHVARYLRDRNVEVFGLDLSAAMLEQARALNPDIAFHEGNMLDLRGYRGSLTGIVAFYAIVNLSTELLPRVFGEMARALQPDGLLLLAFHIGREVLVVDELWEQRVELEFILFDPSEVRAELEAVGLSIEELIERDPYPDVEYRSRRAYILARKATDHRNDR